MDLVVFPEYVLGHIQVPGPSTQRIAAAAAANRIYVIVGCWEEYQDGTFAKNWVSEYEAGLPEYNRLMREDLESQIETVGKALRGRMAWLQD